MYCTRVPKTRDKGIYLKASEVSRLSRLCEKLSANSACHSHRALVEIGSRRWETKLKKGKDKHNDKDRDKDKDKVTLTEHLSTEHKKRLNKNRNTKSLGHKDKESQLDTCFDKE